MVQVPTVASGKDVGPLLTLVTFEKGLKDPGGEPETGVLNLIQPLILRLQSGLKTERSESVLDVEGDLGITKCSYTPSRCDGMGPGVSRLLSEET